MVSPITGFPLPGQSRLMVMLRSPEQTEEFSDQVAERSQRVERKLAEKTKPTLTTLETIMQKRLPTSTELVLR